MSFIRPTSALARFLPTTQRTLLPSSTRQLSTSALRRAQGYGDGKGDPKGSDPEAQGSSSKKTEAAEHPGPAAPAEGQGSGGATKANAQSGGAASKEAKETGSSPTGGTQKRGFHTLRQFSTSRSMSKDGDAKIPSNGARPAISDKGDAGGKNNEISKEKKEEVERHNKEFDEKHDKARDTKDGKRS